MPDRQRPELLMPVSDEGAALQFFVEAMKQNTSTLQQVGRTMQGMQEEQKETLKLVHDTRERIIRIESNSINAEVAELKRDVAELKNDKLRREGAGRLASGAIRNGPIVISLLIGLVTIIVVLVANGKI
jgi:polyhydroxyalkanoate synthesis regulator phasin